MDPEESRDLMSLSDDSSVNENNQKLNYIKIKKRVAVAKSSNETDSYNQNSGESRPSRIDNNMHIVAFG